jgi:hypothetical protein
MEREATDWVAQAQRRLPGNFFIRQNLHQNQL